MNLEPLSNARWFVHRTWLRRQRHLFRYTTLDTDLYEAFCGVAFYPGELEDDDYGVSACRVCREFAVSKDEADDYQARIEAMGDARLSVEFGLQRRPGWQRALLETESDRRSAGGHRRRR